MRHSGGGSSCCLPQVTMCEFYRGFFLLVVLTTAAGRRLSRAALKPTSDLRGNLVKVIKTLPEFLRNLGAAGKFYGYRLRQAISPQPRIVHIMVSQTSDELILELAKAPQDLAMTLGPPAMSLGTSIKGPQTWAFEILGCT